VGFSRALNETTGRESPGQQAQAHARKKIEKKKKKIKIRDRLRHDAPMAYIQACAVTVEGAP